MKIWTVELHRTTVVYLPVVAATKREAERRAIAEGPRSDVFALAESDVDVEYTDEGWPYDAGDIPYPSDAADAWAVAHALDPDATIAQWEAALAAAAPPAVDTATLPLPGLP